VEGGRGSPGDEPPRLHPMVAVLAHGPFPSASHQPPPSRATGSSAWPGVPSRQGHRGHTGVPGHSRTPRQSQGHPWPPPASLPALTQPPALHGTGLILLHDAEAGGAGPGPGPLPGLHSPVAQPVGLLQGEVPGPRQAEHACKHSPCGVSATPQPCPRSSSPGPGQSSARAQPWRFPQLRDITAGWGVQAPRPSGLKAALLGCARQQSPLGWVWLTLWFYQASKGSRGDPSPRGR